MTVHLRQTRYKRRLLASAILAGIACPPTQAATIIVDGSGCSLPDAITAANTDAAVGGCSAGSGADVLELATGSISLSATLPRILSPITVNGNGVTITGDQTFPLIRINDGLGSTTGSLTLNDATLTQGASGGFGDDNLGGGIACYDGGLTMNNIRVTDTLGGAVVLNRCDTTIASSTLRNNTSNEFGDRNGSGLSIISGQATISDSSFTDNVHRSDVSGGAGIYLTNPDGDTVVTISNTTIANNASFQRGGGLSHRDNGNTTSLTLSNSTISGNSSYGGGGGLALDTGVTATGSNLTITANTTTGGGTGSFYGGGLFNNGADITLSQSIIAGNTASYSAGNEIESFSGTVTLDAFNLIGVEGDAGLSGVTAGASDIVPTETLADILDPVLADNGGATATHLLSDGSPALEITGLTVCANGTDQRGLPRPMDGDGIGGAQCDIGAVESLDLILDADLSVTLQNNATPPVVLGDQFQLALTASNAGPVDASGVVVTTALSGQLTYLSDDCGSTVAGSTLSWSVGNLPVGANALCEISVQISGIASISNSARITGDQNDPVTGNDTASDTLAGVGRVRAVPTLTGSGLLAMILGLFWCARRRLLDPV